MTNPPRHWTVAARPTARLVEHYVAAGWWREESLMDDLHCAAREVPSEVALIGWRQQQQALTTITFGDLSARVDRLASGLANMGIRTGDRVASYLPNRWESVALTLACARIGAVAVPVMLFFAPRDLERILAATEAVVCVTSASTSANDIDAEHVLAEMAPRVARAAVSARDRR